MDKNRKSLLLALSLYLAAQLCAFAGAPAGYYKSLEGLSGQALKNAVHNLVASHTVLTYASLWTYFPSTDCYPDNKSRVYDMYSDNQYFFRGGGSSTSGMHKEHSFPKSWWGGTEVDAYTDINHLYPADGPANLAKSNYPLGEVLSASFDNGVTKVGTPVKGQGGGAGTVFEPDDRYKGDFARTYFYMATCYQQYYWKYTYMVNNSDWKTLNSWAIDLLLRWARNDSVSEKETSRNDAVYRVQNNRNPFIDLPELAEYIWGDKQGYVFTLDGTGGGTQEPVDPELITPTQGTVLNFGEVAIGKSITYTLYVKGINLTTDLSVQLYKGNYQMFSVNTKTITRSEANSDKGFPLVITYTPTAVGDHTAKLLLSDGGITGSVGVELTASCREVPTLHILTATPATDVTDSSFVAHWEPSNDIIDYYVLNHVVYDENGDDLVDESIIVDAEECSYQIDGMKPGETHYYSVQSSRLGCLSQNSNEITVVAGSAKLGDMNGDGAVNSADVSALVNAILASATDSKYDVNGDGGINSADVSALVNLILGM